MLGARRARREVGNMEGKLRAYWPLPLRVFLGIAFMVHGAPKLFSGAGHEGFVGMLQQIGIPAPAFMAWVVGFVELFGGIALIVGLFTAEVAVLLGIEMLVAMLTVHAGHGFQFVQIAGTTAEGAPIFGLPGVEVNLLYIAGLLALLIGGPGPLSVDERVLEPESRLRPPWLRRRAAHA
jgi:putative oxidoreductase